MLILVFHSLVKRIHYKCNQSQFEIVIIIIEVELNQSWVGGTLVRMWQKRWQTNEKLVSGGMWKKERELQPL